MYISPGDSPIHYFVRVEFERQIGCREVPVLKQGQRDLSAAYGFLTSRDPSWSVIPVHVKTRVSVYPEAPLSFYPGIFPPLVGRYSFLRPLT